MEYQKIFMKVPPVPSTPKKTQMTFWSRTDPVRAFEGNTNYWSIMRDRANLQSLPKIAESIRAAAAVAAAKSALKAIQPIKAVPSKKATNTLHRTDPKKFRNSCYLLATRGYKYWPYDLNDPFTYPK